MQNLDLRFLQNENEQSVLWRKTDALAFPGHFWSVLGGHTGRNVKYAQSKPSCLKNQNFPRNVRNLSNQNVKTESCECVLEQAMHRE